MSKCERCHGASGTGEVEIFALAGFHHVLMCAPCSREWDRKTLKGAWQRLELARRALNLRMTSNGPPGSLEKCVDDVASARQLMISWFTLFLLSDYGDEEETEAVVDAAERAEAES